MGRLAGYGEFLFVRLRELGTTCRQSQAWSCKNNLQVTTGR